MFLPQMRATGIGSLPHRDRQSGLDFIFRHFPEIPFWPQFPKMGEEMAADFVGGDDPEGFRLFVERLGSADVPRPAALKGQLVGPLTLSLWTQVNSSAPVFSGDRLDKLLSDLCTRAEQQTKRLLSLHETVIIFLDEPALSRSEPLPIHPPHLVGLWREVIGSIRSAGGIAGIHCCADPRWDLLFEAAPDILSFDAYRDFFALAACGEQITAFLLSGGLFAFGIVPTGEEAEKESAERLSDRLEAILGALVPSRFGTHDRSATWRLAAQSLVTPSCGLGLLPSPRAERIASLTLSISRRLKERYAC